MHMANEAPEREGTRNVTLTLEAEPGATVVVRTLAETLSVLGDFTLDEVADIKLAVDESCSQLVALAADDAQLITHFAMEDSQLEVSVSALLAADCALEQTEFGWHVLCTLADDVEVIAPAADSDALTSGAATQRPTTTIIFTKRKNGGR